MEKDYAYLRQQDTVLIANIAGSTEEAYCQIASYFDKTGIDMLELNISCPNVRQGGVAFGTDPKMVEKIVGMVRRSTTKPLMVKLSPNVTDITETARAAEAAGADALSLINTLTGMRIDIRTRRPILHNNTGGLSGPAVFPVAVRMVWQVANAVRLPVVGLGGIARWQDAVEMMMAGARAVQVGTALFGNPMAPVEIVQGMDAWLDSQGIRDVNEIVGSVKPW